MMTDLIINGQSVDVFLDNINTKLHELTVDIRVRGLSLTGTADSICSIMAYISDIRQMMKPFQDANQPLFSDERLVINALTYWLTKETEKK